MTKKIFMTYIDIIQSQCEKENMKKILVDLLNVSDINVPTMDRFYMGEKIAKVLGSKIKIAVVGPKEQINKFGENVAVNRGGRLFVAESFETARHWLFNDIK